MAEPFLGEIRMMSFNFPPRGWAFCNGQTLSIAQNAALFSILGTTYGGNGTTTFALPNLQGRTPIHFGNGFVEGQVGGEQSHTLVGSEAAHVHLASANNAAANSASPHSGLWSNAGIANYAASADVSMAPQAVSNQGGNQPHENRSPFLVISFCIALQGIFPSRN